jgi:hypothetical protein
MMGQLYASDRGARDVIATLWVRDSNKLVSSFLDVLGAFLDESRSERPAQV